MNIFPAALMAFLAFYAIMDIICVIVKKGLRKSFAQDTVIIYVKSRQERLEPLVRSLITANPGAEIVVINEENSPELREIVNLLCKDYACVHIGECEYSISSKEKK